MAIVDKAGKEVGGMVERIKRVVAVATSGLGKARSEWTLARMVS